MIFVEMLRWWYSTGWTGAARRIGDWTRAVERMFSLSLLLQTIFSPWRRIISVAGKGLDAKVQAALDNLISRVIGSVIRIFVIIAACVSMLGALVFGVVMFVIWPLLPPLTVIFLVKGITG
jgi:hypothetical protein